MRIAIPVFDSRISPVFDFSTHLEIIDIGNNGEMSSRGIAMQNLSIYDRLNILRNENVEVLICAGLCRELNCSLQSVGIEVISGIIGAREEVIKGYLNGELDDPRFMMPGCWRQRRRRGNGRSRSTFRSRLKRGSIDYEGSHIK